MKQRIKFDGNKRMVIIQTPVFSSSFTQVTCLMTEDEYELARTERPDLVFRYASEMEEVPEGSPVGPDLTLVQEPEDETKGITVKGLTLPHDLDALINHLFEKR
jgi:hypothetical protein